VLAAILWDVDGTLAETERDGHLSAFNAAFEAAGVPWRWSESRYGELLRVAGGRERLVHDMDSQPDAPPAASDRAALAERVHRLKNDAYVAIMAAGGFSLREGVHDLLLDCRRATVRLGIVTTTGRANVEALLNAQLGSNWARWFDCVVCAEDAPRKKPDPEAYRLALERLALPASATLAIEDSPNGVEAARNAGVPVIRVRSRYFAEGGRNGEIAVGPSLASRSGWDPTPEPPISARIDLEQLRRWHAAVPRALVPRDGYR
jgi:HAD superfamily hydrolase (TIGR01509 family)